MYGISTTKTEQLNRQCTNIYS